MQRKAKIAGAATSLLAAAIVAQLGMGAATATQVDQVQPHRPAFTMAGLSQGSYASLNRGISARSIAGAEATGLSTMRIGDGHAAVVDRSMQKQGMATATSPGVVDLAWTAKSNALGYAVVRDGKLIATLPAGANAYEDLAVTDGASYRYVVSATGVKPNSGESPVWGVGVTVPNVTANESEDLAVARSARTRITAKTAAATTTLSWIAFIPEAKVAAPPAGCTYNGSKYYYGGDGHGYDWTTSKYRTALHATVTWSNKAVVGNASIGTTHVYKSSDGSLVAKKTASAANMVSKKLGSTSTSVDIRMVNHAQNPFCSVGAIDGAMTITLTHAGDWTIHSGNVRRAPDHYIYIYDGGAVTDVLRVNEQNIMCLVGAAACDLFDMTGYYGTFA